MGSIPGTQIPFATLVALRNGRFASPFTVAARLGVKRSTAHAWLVGAQDVELVKSFERQPGTRLFSLTPKGREALRSAL